MREDFFAVEWGSYSSIHVAVDDVGIVVLSVVVSVVVSVAVSVVVSVVVRSRSHCVMRCLYVTDKAKSYC